MYDWLPMYDGVLFFSPQCRHGKYYHLHFVCITTFRLTIQTISFSLMIEYRIIQEKPRPYKRFTSFSSCNNFGQSTWSNFSFLVEIPDIIHDSNNCCYVFRGCEANLTINSSKIFGLDRTKFKIKLLNLGSSQRSVPERTSFLSLRFVSNSIHLVMTYFFRLKMIISF